MLVLIQSLKILFLLLTTSITIYFFIRNYKTGFKYYMYFVIISALLGFTRPIFAEEIILPILIPLSVFAYYKKFNPDRISYISLFILVYGIFITLITEDASFKGVDTFFIYGFLLLSFSNYIFGGKKFTIHAYSLIWLYVLAKVIWLVANGGSSVFLLSDLTHGGSRLIEFKSELDSSTGNVIIDPNYLGFITGLGFVLSFMFLFYRNQLYRYFNYKIIKKTWFFVIVLIIGIVELWLSLRGISRGILLAIIASILAFLLLNRQFKTFAIFSAVIVIMIFVFSNVIDLFFMRFTEDTTGGGRFDYWNFIWNFMIDEDKVLFGFGLNYSWWQKWEFGVAYISTHNSWLTLLLAVGLFGMILLVVFMIKSIIINYKSNSIIGKIRIVMLAYLIVSCFSIEPLINNLGWILFAISTTYEIKNVSVKSKKWRIVKSL